jgi:hypothetical protein
VNVEVTLWFFASVLVFATANLLVGAIVLRKRTSTPAITAIPVLDILALALITLVVMAALMIVIQLILPAAPAVGRPLMSLVGALLIEVLKRLFALLPNAPRWLPRLLRILEFLLLALAVSGIVLTFLLRLV